MIRKLLTVTLCGAIAGMLCLAYSDTLFTAWNHSRFFPSPSRFGDLYNLTNLRKFKERDYESQSVLKREELSAFTPHDDLHLYLFGDSFTNRIAGACYSAGQTTFERVGVSSREVSLDTSKINVLIIQNVERGITDRFNRRDYIPTFMHNAGFYTPAMKQTFERAASANAGVWADFGGGAVEERLQLLLGNYRPLLLLKEAKAWLNLELLGKVDGHNILSQDQQHVFYHNEASRTVGYTSSFYPVPDSVVAQFVEAMAEIEAHYRAMGFDYVYFVIIPNKATILAPHEGYNQLIPRIHRQALGRVPVLDMYRLLKNTTHTYHRGDGHWNKNGMKLWVEAVNYLLDSLADAPPAAASAQRQAPATTPAFSTR
jgi:hypothetical protein